MIQIIEERKKPKLRDQFARAFANMGQELPNLVGQYQQNQRLERETQAVKDIGLDPNLRPELQKLMMQYQLMGGLEEQKGQNQLNVLEQKQRFQQDELARKLQGEKREKAAPFMNALDTINEMRAISKRGNLGRWSGISSTFGGKTAEDFGKYQQLGKSLISFASTIPIRNKAEFEVLAENLYDPTIPDRERKGILDAMEDIIRKNMSTYLEENSIEQPALSPQQSIIQKGRQFDRRHR
jgi:hypothetical protein